MQRRNFITLLGGAASAWPLAARAQQDGRVRRVGYITGQSEDDPEAKARRTAFVDALEKLRWAAGRNVRIDYRWGVVSPEGVRRTAAELVGSAPDVILAEGQVISDALQRETRTIPIVFAVVADPLGTGLIDSMARPSRNLTGFANYEFAIGGKWLEMLKEAAPGVNRVLIILGVGNTAQQGMLKSIESAGSLLGVQPVAGPARDAAEIERAIGNFALVPNGGLLVMPGSPGRDHSDLIITLAAQYRLPAIYTYRFYPAKGGLMSYDTDIVDLYRRAASYVDRILRGEKPSDLPVQLPTKYDLVINLKVAKSLNLTVPLPLLALADEVIE